MIRLPPGLCWVAASSHAECIQIQRLGKMSWSSSAASWPTCNLKGLHFPVPWACFDFGLLSAPLGSSVRSAFPFPRLPGSRPLPAASPPSLWCGGSWPGSLSPGGCRRRTQEA